MSRIWRGDVRLLLAVAAALEVLLVVYTRTAGAALNAHQPLGPQVAETGFGLFLLWRVWRGGRIAWLVMVVMDALLLVATAAGVTAVGPYLAGLWGYVAVQLAVLLSPAVRRQVGGHRGRAVVGR
jgi:hypothetical protein